MLQIHAMQSECGSRVMFLGELLSNIKIHEVKVQPKITFTDCSKQTFHHIGFSMSLVILAIHQFLQSGNQPMRVKHSKQCAKNNNGTKSRAQNAAESGWEKIENQETYGNIK